MPPRFLVSWHPRTDPLIPTAVAARGATAASLAHRLLQRSEEEIGRLRGVAAPGLLVVSGPTDLLPWADGALYLGQDPAAPLLLTPTTLHPSVPIALVERALRASYPAAAPPVAVLAPWSQLVSLEAARSIDANYLRTWLEKER